MHMLGMVSWPVFIGLTVLLMGFAAFMTGQGRANGWRPVGQVVLYTLLLGLGDRFLVFALFQGPLLSVPGYLLDTAVLMAISLTAFRVTQTRKMVSQYPWMYQRSSLFAWEDKHQA